MSGLAIPFFHRNGGVPPLIFMTWYFGGVALRIVLLRVFRGRAAERVPHSSVILAVLIGMTFGALANGSLFQAMSLAPNPGLPPVIYASASVIVFLLSILLHTHFPALLRPAHMEYSRLLGIVLVIAGLYFVTGGKLKLP